MKIHGYWHCYLINNWYSIITDQMRILLTSGLYDACEEINIGCIGSPKNKESLERLVISPHSKLKIKYYSQNPLEYEFPTLKLIEADNFPYIGFYFHLKGVTKPTDDMQLKERTFLNEIMLNQWRTHRYIIETGYDISSVNYLTIPNRFSGNYFWFNRERMNKLPKIDDFDLTNRFNAEYWIYKTR